MSVKRKIALFFIVICLYTMFVAGCVYNWQTNKVLAAMAETEEYYSIWTATNVDIKKEPRTESETIGTFGWDAELVVTNVDDNWVRIKDSNYYIDRNFLTETSVNYVNRDVLMNNSIKSYMDYRFITSKSSDQYKLQESLAYTGDNGLRMVNGRYCIAVGSYYTTTIGQYLDIELENGNVINAILADCKADIHTDATNRINPNGSVIEFVVETESLDPMARKMGDISYVNGWDSKVINIRVYDKVEEF